MQKKCDKEKIIWNGLELNNIWLHIFNFFSLPWLTFVQRISSGGLLVFLLWQLITSFIYLRMVVDGLRSLSWDRDTWSCTLFLCPLRGNVGENQRGAPTCGRNLGWNQLAQVAYIYRYIHYLLTVMTNRI